MSHRFRFFTPAGDPLPPPAEVAVLDDEDARRLHRVLRLPAGSVIELGDGRGAVALAEIVDAKAGRVRIGESVAAVPALPIHVRLAQSGPRADDAVEKLVELGVEAIGALATHGRRRPPNRERWERIARNAAMQAKCAVVPAILPEVDLAAALIPGAILCSHEAAEVPLDDALAGASAPTVLLIGPEAGFDDEEHAAASAAGVPIVRLGDTVLRSETAAIVAVALVADRLRRGRLEP